MTRERTVLLVVHTGREEATETARRVEKVLHDNGISLRVLSAEAVDRGPLHLGPDDMRALGVDIEVVDADPNAGEGCELVIGLGGDGTFLRAAELARNAEIPVLGINLGRIGFLAEAETEAIDSCWTTSSRELPHRRTTHPRHRGVGEGQGAVPRLGPQRSQPGKGAAAGVLGVVLEVDGRPVSTFGCDGVLVHTHRLHGLRVLRGRTHPVAGSRGIVGGAQQRSRFVRPADGHQPRRADRHRNRGRRARRPGFCDGRREMLVPAGARLEVRRCDVSVKWARLDSAPFTDRLVRKFRLPVTGWRGR